MYVNDSSPKRRKRRKMRIEATVTAAHEHFDWAFMKQLTIVFYRRPNLSECDQCVLQLAQMAEESPTPPPPQATNSPSSEQSNPAELPPPVSTPPTTVQDRVELLARARIFLNSPQILEQDVTAKRKFLSEKGLSELEIERLLREPVRASWFP
jgi:hypothetical protein